MANEKIYVGEIGAKELYRQVKKLIPTEVPGNGKLKVQLGNSQAADTGFTANTDDDHTLVIGSASTSAQGVVQLSNAIDSSSETNAATSKAVKDAYDALDAKMKARAVFFGSVSEWNTYKSEHPEGDPSKVYYVQTGSGEDKYTVYVWKVVPDGVSVYEETDESSISLDGYWYGSPSVVDDPSSTDTFVSGIALNQNGTVSVTRKPVQNVKSDWAAAAGSASEILNKPNLSTVAFTGSYNDLLDKPSTPSGGDSWKLWSENNGSSSDDPTSTSVYIGKDNTITSSANGDALIAGNNNTVAAHTGIAVGYNNQIASGSYQSVTVGIGNTLDGGNNITAIGRNLTFGHDSGYGSRPNDSTLVVGHKITCKNTQQSAVFGNNNSSLNNNQSVIFGSGNLIENIYLGAIYAYSSTIRGSANINDATYLLTLVGYSNTMVDATQSVLLGQASEILGYTKNSSGASKISLSTYDALCGFQSHMRGSDSAVFGTWNNAYGDSNVLCGSHGSIGIDSADKSGSSDYNVMVGLQASIREKSHNNVVMCEYGSVDGNSNIVFGSSISVSGNSNLLFGTSNTTSGVSSSMLFGKYNTPSNDSMTFGAYNSTGRNSMTIGLYNHSEYGDNPYAITVGYYNNITNNVQSVICTVDDIPFKAVYPATQLNDVGYIGNIPSGATNKLFELTQPASPITPHEYAQFTGPTTEGEYYLFRELLGTSYLHLRGVSGKTYRVQYHTKYSSSYRYAYRHNDFLGDIQFLLDDIERPDTITIQVRNASTGEYENLPDAVQLGIVDEINMKPFEYAIIRLDNGSFWQTVRLPAYRSYKCVFDYSDSHTEVAYSGTLGETPKLWTFPLRPSTVSVTSVTITEVNPVEFMRYTGSGSLQYALNTYIMNSTYINYTAEVPVRLSYTTPAQTKSVQTDDISIGTYNTIYGHNGCAIGTYNVIDTSDEGLGFGTAIGFSCHSNADLGFAMGYRSIVNGEYGAAFGTCLIASDNQHVIGKYNVSKSGPSRKIAPYKTTETYVKDDVVVKSDVYYKCISETSVTGTWDSSKWETTVPDADKVLFVVGNGYTEDDADSTVHRSNALELYADGTLKITGSIEASNLPPAPVADGDYTLACTVTNGVASYRWAAIGYNN